MQDYKWHSIILKKVNHNVFLTALEVPHLQVVIFSQEESIQKHCSKKDDRLLYGKHNKIVVGSVTDKKKCQVHCNEGDSPGRLIYTQSNDVFYCIATLRRLAVKYFVCKLVIVC